MEQEYAVDHISDPEFKDGAVSFLVHWSTGEETREPLKNLVPGCLESLLNWSQCYRRILKPEYLEQFDRALDYAITHPYQ
ncbi:hypothetical protein GPJ56_001003 [Histomonas meleagridis]|nr:hypothetical protein GPJ56_009669 [Histomonas meleagridis]KAH0793302.1 hypothetical protein GPJ56_002783 [Histomonas meleagridis]KAH0795048.1 hypothetical protein GPJ56_001003 [Histomonas meleagridis]